MKRLLPCLILPLALLGACQSRDTASLASAPRYASLDAAFAAPLAARRLDRHAGAVAALPHWIGRPSQIQAAERPDGTAQRVTFAAAKGSARLVAAWPQAGAASPDLPPKPTRDGIRGELAAALPGVAMEVVTRPARNAYGPYGLAIGRDGEDRRCLYAWQWIEAPPALGVADAGRPLSLRFSLCRADLTFDAMAAAYDRLRLVPAEAGEAGEAVAAAPRPRRAKVHPAAVAEPAPAPALVPQPASAPDTAGRRYLGADLAPPPRSALASVAATVHGAGPSPEPSARPALDLPPEALRGPATDPSRPRP